jgi:hypothetical protein
MAITATLSVNPSTVQSPSQLVTVTLTISQNLAGSLNVINVVPYALDAAGHGSTAVLLGLPNTGPGQNMTIPTSGGGNLVLTWSASFVAPPQSTYASNPFAQGSYPGGAAITPLIPLAQPSSVVFTLGCTLYTADGTVTIPSTATVTVTGLAAA